VSGVLVPPADVAALSQALSTAASRPQARITIGQAARRRAEVFDIRHTVRRLEALYGRLAEGTAA
jgi:glycosyltransferase involved in cell wall biosynthesis